MTTKHRSAAALSKADPEAPLESWCLDPPEATLGFAVKLARENGSTTRMRGPVFVSPEGQKWTGSGCKIRMVCLASSGKEKKPAQALVLEATENPRGGFCLRVR
jgi:hypothetical protein